MTALAVTPERLTATIDAEKSGNVRIITNDFPRWRAWRNGQPIAIERTNDGYMSLPLPAGESTIELRYVTSTANWAGRGLVTAGAARHPRDLPRADSAPSLAATRVIDLQPLFAAPIIEQYAYPAAYPDHTNDIWRVRTATEDRGGPRAAPGRRVGPRGEPLLARLPPPLRPRPDRHRAPRDDQRDPGRLSPLPIPRVLRSGTVAGRPCLVVEHLPGERLDDLRALPPAALRELGAAIARIHTPALPLVRHARWHDPTTAGRRSTPASPTRCASWQPRHPDPTLAAPLDEFCAAALALPAPTNAAPVMLDVDATQFLTDGTRLTALVDTDAYAVAPPALDLIGYEYELDAPAAAAFAAGYRTIAPLPDLTAVRPVYRYLSRLLETQGAVPLDEWLAWPGLFSSP